MSQYAQHFSTRQTPQTERADSRQVENSAGGYSFAVDDWKRLDRFLILGADGGSYYATERELTRENAQCVIRCLDEDPARAVEAIASISEQGRAPKNDPAVFALAIAAGHEKAASLALAALPRVCRIGTHLFQFVDAVKGFRGWGRSLKRAVAKWYEGRDERDLCYQLVKYQQRNGRSHRDLFRHAHPEPKYPGVYRYVAAGAASMGDRAVSRKSQGGASISYAATGELPVYLAAFEELKRADAKRTIELIREHRFTHEMVASEHKNSPAVWEALLADMPIGAMVRNLGKMTEVGLLKPMSNAARTVAERLGEVERIRKARLHPIALLSALRVYAQGHGEKGKLRWEAAPQIVDALDAAFYLGFDAIEPTGKRMLLAIDVSGSMDAGVVAGVPGLTPRMAAAAMAMATARVEKNWHIVGFSNATVPGAFAYGSGRSMHYGYNACLTPLAITPRQRLDDVARAMQAVPMGGTDCALPMLYAAAKELEVDCFAIYTDSETWHGDVHPFQALKAYRAKSGINAKLAVVACVANGFSIAEPSDSGMLDIVGMDTATPNVLAEFARW